MLVRRSPFRLQIKKCPRCFTRLTEMFTTGGIIAPQIYGCHSCGYVGPVYFEEIGSVL